MGFRAVETSASREFDQVARAHEAALLAVAMRLCGNWADARDLVQDTFERGLEAIAGLRPDSNVRAWLITILHNRFIDHCRRARRAPHESIAPDHDPAAPEPVEQPVWASVTSEQLHDALASLPDEFRAVYRMHAVDGRSYQEIADALKIPKATVGTRLMRARTKLRAVLFPARSDEETQP